MTRTLSGTDGPDPTAPDNEGITPEQMQQELRDAAEMWSYPSGTIPLYPPPAPELVHTVEYVQWAFPGVAPFEPDSLQDESEYREIRTPVPPVIALEDGQLVVKLIAGNLTLVAPLGDGAWFFHQLVEKLVDPALRAYWLAAREPGAPND